MNNMILNSLMANLSNGVVTFVLGMGIVFIVLILLIYIIKAITAIVRGKPQQEVSAPAVQPLIRFRRLFPLRLSSSRKMKRRSSPSLQPQ